MSRRSWHLDARQIIARSCSVEHSGLETLSQSLMKQLEACIHRETIASSPRVLEQAALTRKAGNINFQAGDMDSLVRAVEIYDTAVKGLPLLAGPERKPSEDPLRTELVLLYSNASECLLKLGYWKEALNSATSALMLDPSHEKSLKRRQRALHGMLLCGRRVHWAEAVFADATPKPAPLIERPPPPSRVTGLWQAKDVGAEDQGALVSGLPTLPHTLFYARGLREVAPLHWNPDHQWLPVLVYDCLTQLPPSEQAKERRAPNESTPRACRPPVCHFQFHAW